ncbi:MAG: 4Fe-4S binding protein [Verrucomicrobia bacterium]|nr:4Fe-4S binding protein [Verrucomicrobiota bacterium]
MLLRLGPSWQASPVRRTIQAVCLLLYLDLFFHVSWPYAVLFSSHVLKDREWLPVETFLWLDPLVGLSTALAARWWNVALLGMAAILATGLVFQRGFCGYLCPLGTLIDVFDFVVGKRIASLKTPQVGRWSNLRFYLLAAVLAASCGGVLLSGFVAALPVLTRGLLFSAGNVQLGLAKNWGMVPPLTAAVWVSLGLFAVVFLLGLIGPRFWCRSVCPSGALLSLPSFFRRVKRQVDDRCIDCGKCVEVCPFDAIQPDFGTRTLHCTLCQTCGGVCPAEAINFVPLSTTAASTRPDVTLAQPLTRRAMLGSVAGGAAAAMLTRLAPNSSARPIRPPGSLAEERFLDLCIRCEQCLKVCPGPVLQAAGLEHGFESLWTPVAVFPHAGCHQDCNFCTQVCPTGAIQPLALAEKRRFVMGLAVVDTATCLPHRGERDCQLCFDECNAAGYRAIEMRPIKLATGQIPEGAFSPDEIEQMGQILAPFVKADACVGCGLCEYRCHSALVSQQKLLRRSAVVVAVPRLRTPDPAPRS